MCDEAAADFLAALKLIFNWFVTSKMIKKLYTLLYADDGLLFYENSGDVIFCCNEIGILSVCLNNINLDNKFDVDDPDTIIVIRLLTWHSKLKNHKAIKKIINEELMPMAWHPKIWWHFCMSEDKKNEIAPFFE